MIWWWFFGSFLTPGGLRIHRAVSGVQVHTPPPAPHSSAQYLAGPFSLKTRVHQLWDRLLQNASVISASSFSLFFLRRTFSGTWPLGLIWHLIKKKLFNLLLSTSLLLLSFLEKYSQLHFLIYLLAELFLSSVCHRILVSCTRWSLLSLWENYIHIFKVFPVFSYLRFIPLPLFCLHLFHCDFLPLKYLVIYSFIFCSDVWFWYIFVFLVFSH